MARILVVDDDKDILVMAEKLLGHYGHTTVTAGDAIRAMEILNSTSFDMVISDANMPHYSGFEMIKTIRSHAHLQHLAIVMLTGLRERKDVQKAIDSGADDYIVKPIDPILFMQKIDSLFEKRPPSKHPEIEFKEQSAQTAATMTISIFVKSISELGVKVESNQALQEGTTVDLTGHFFENQLGIEPPACRVLNSLKVSPGKHEIQMVFLGASEYQLKKIREWIFSHGSMIRRDQDPPKAA